MPTLHVLQGPDKGHTFDVPQSPTLIGRDSPDLPLSDNTISRRHAELTATNGTWSITDLNSANGTYVNGVKVSRSLDVKKGDQIRCGSTLIVFGAVQSTGIPGEPAASLRIDEDGNLVESAIMATVPSMDDSVIIAGPETSSAIGNLRLLYELSTAISSIFDREQLLDKVMDIIFDNFPADRGFILLTDGHEQLRPMVVRYRSQKESGQIDVSHTIVDHVLRNQEGVICSNAMRDPRFQKGKSVQDYGIRSALCVPVTVRDRNVGVIYVDCIVATHTYAADQLRLLTAIGFQTGLALEHARLYRSGVQAERLAAAGETVAVLSHGIKNVLQGLQSAADMVQLGLDKNKLDVAMKGWDILQRNLNRINNLVLNMLAFSKVRQPNTAMIQLNMAVTEVIDMLTGHADEKAVALIADLDDQLPPIAVDPDGIQQVLLNLTLNALDAVEPEHGVITFKTTYDSQAAQAVLTVSDNGAGIEPARLDSIFDAFRSSKGHLGTGLGLAVVKKIIEEHNGQAEVTSQVGEGTTFTLRIPPTGSRKPGSESTAGPTRRRRRGFLFH